MSRSTFVTFIGSGNLAWHLAPALDNTEYGVREVYSRNPNHATELVAKLYEAEVKDSLDFSESKSGIFIIATSDDAIESVIHRIVLPDDAVLVHTSGSQALSILKGTTTENIGVFYPLQTFSKKKKVEFTEVPLFIESENKSTERDLLAMAKTISNKVRKISSDERTALHIAAVFASNFTNHMLTISRQIMKQNKLDYDWLKPLIAETITKSLDIGPEFAQTGPARRGDLEILDRQFDFLKDDEPIGEIYKLISQHILDRYES